MRIEMKVSLLRDSANTYQGYVNISGGNKKVEFVLERPGRTFIISADDLQKVLNILSEDD